MPTQNQMLRKQLVNAYIDRILEGMDRRTLLLYAGDKLALDLADYSDEELRQEIASVAPDLLPPEPPAGQANHDG